MGTPPRQENPNQESPEWTRQKAVVYSHRRKSPVLAGLLSIMPGLGQVYVGYYQRGFVHALIVFSIIAILSSGSVEFLAPLFGAFISFFWFYNVIDAVRLAGFYNEALAGGAAGDFRPQLKPFKFGGSIFGGVILVVLGFILFLNTKFEVSLDWLEDWWPLAAILLGVYLIYKGIQERKGLAG